MTKKYRSDAMAAIHETVESLYVVGAIDKRTMHRFDEACLTPILFGLAFVIKLVQTLMTGVVNLWLPLWGVLFVYFLYRYFRPMFKIEHSSKVWQFCKIRYISNWALMKGGFVGGKTFGVIYLESSW